MAQKFHSDIQLIGSSTDLSLQDGGVIKLGTGNDLKLYHDGTNSFIENETGNLYIFNKANDKDIIFATDNGSGGTANYITLDGSHNKIIAHKDIHFDDNVKVQFGNYATPDLLIYHDGSNSYIETSTSSAGDLYIKAQGSGHDLYLQATDDVLIRPQGGNNGIKVIGQGAVELYYNNSKKFETTNIGVTITGTANSNALYLYQGDFTMHGGSSGQNDIRWINTWGNWRIEVGDGANNFKIHSESLNADYLTLEGGGQLTLNEYGSGSFTGTAAYNLAVTSSGEVIEVTGGSGSIDGSGAAGRVAFWTDGDTLSSDSVFYYDNTNNRLGVNVASPAHKLDISTGNGDTTRTVSISHTRNDADVGTNALYIDANFTGTKTASTDTTQTGIYIDFDSSADGTTSDEVRSYGIYSDTRFTGMSDVVYSGYFRAESNNVTEKTSNMYGAFGLATHDSSSTSGGVSHMAGVKGQSDIQDYGDVDNAYGLWGLVNIANNRNANVDATFGVVGEIQIDEATALTYGTMAAVKGVIDNNEGSVPNFGTQYLFHGDYQGTEGTGSYGLYVEGSRHYLSNKLGIGTSNPDANFHIESTDPTIILAQSGAVNQSASGRILFAEGPSYTTNPHFEIKYDGAANRLQFNSPIDSLTNIMNIGRDGNIGINVASPDNALDIDSSYTNSVHIQGTGSYNLYSYHDSGGVGWATGSGTSYDNLIYLHAASDTIKFYTSGSERASISSSGVFSKANVYSADTGDFRNYGGEWHATTGVSGNGFKFTNTADNVDALTLTAAGNATFAGEIAVNGGKIAITESSTTNELFTMNASSDVYADQIWADNGGSIRLRNHGGTFRLYTGGSANSLTASGATEAFTLSTSQNATFTGNVIITGSGTANSGSLQIDNPSSSSFNHSIEAFAANLTNGESNVILVGKEGSTKNSGYLGYYWTASGSNNNFVSLGHWAADHLFRVYGDSVLSTVTLRSDVDMQAPIFYDKNDTGYYVNPNGQSKLSVLQMVGDIRGNGQQLVLNAGESAAYFTGQTSEHVYINAEGGLQVVSSPDNWSSGWAGRYTTTIGNSSGNSIFPNDIYVGDQIIHSGDTDTYLQFNAANTWRVVVGGSQKVVVNSNGLNVSNGNVYAPIFYDSDSTTYYIDPANSGTSFYMNGGITGNASQERVKYSVWDGFTYGIGMKNGFSYGHIASGEYCMTFQMNNNNGRGFWWGDDNHSDAQGAMSLTTNGKLTVATSISVGEGQTVTSPGDSPLYIEGGSANWNETTQGNARGTIHLDPGSSTNHFGNAITFGASDSGNGANSHAGIYVRTDGSYGSKMYFSTTDSYATAAKTAMRIEQSGRVYTTRDFLQAANSLRAPIFYDSNNTNYYTNPASTSVLNGLTVGGNTVYGFSGGWNGSNFPGSRWGGYTVNGGEIVFQRDNPSNGKMSVMVDGSFYAGENGGFWSIWSGNNYNNRVGIYGDSSGNLNIGTSTTENILRTQYGYVQVGPMNTSHAHIYTDRPNFYLNKSIQVLGSSIMNQNDIRSKVFYDIDNTSYYVNPASTSHFNDIQVSQYIYHKGDTNTRIQFTGDNIKLRTGGTDRLQIDNTNVKVGSGGTGNIYVGGNTSGQYFRIHHNNSSTYLDAGGAYIYMRSNNGANTRFRFGAGSDGGTLVAAGDVIAYGSPSDITLKENIKPIENALDKVEKLQGVTFDWKEQDITNLKEDIGFIAQDVQKVLPELVRENDNGKLSMRHQGVIPVLVEAIKELKAEIKELKRQIK